MTALNLDLKEYEDYWVGRCPIHEGDNNRSFALFKKTMTWQCHTHHCHGTRKSADIFDLIQSANGLNYGQAVEFVKAVYGVGEISSDILRRIEFDMSVSNMKPRESVGQAIEYQPSGLIELYKEYSNPYYVQRGFDENITRYFEVGYCPSDIDVEDDLHDYVYLKNDQGEYYDKPYFWGRAVIPIHDAAGKLVGFSGRSVNNFEPKFIHTKGLPKTKVLYNWHRAEKYFEMTHEVIIVESPGVVWSWFRAGFQNTVASLNTYLSTEHIRMITRHPQIEKVTIAYDPDIAGREGTKQACNLLKRKVNVSFIELPDGSDYDKMSPDEIRSWHHKRKVVAP